MALKLYNTLTRKEEPEPFRPLDPENVRMYVCGPTVYDFAHIGNARPVIVFDVLFRLLRHIYGPGHVTYVRNITDVDDKINARAVRDFPNLPLNEAIHKVTKKTERQFHKDVATLRCLTPLQVNKAGTPPRFIEPRATEHIEAMKAMIELLVARGCAYLARDHILFRVSAMSDYGKLSRRSLDEMIAGARVEVAPFKHDPMDFVLWKPSKPDEPSWPSPAGITVPGRPGWHIECSAMSWKHLGEVFDIHGGGIDLVFPHHENEIAQSRCAFQRPVMATVWMHNGFLLVDGKKMAKSEGNFVTINELLRTKTFGDRCWPGEVLRTAMLQTHYRQPIDWTVRALTQSEVRLNNWRKFAADRTSNRLNPSLWSELVGFLTNDLNTPAAFSRLDEVASADQSDDRNRYTVFRFLKLLGIRATKSKAAQAAQPLALAARKISRMSSGDWADLIEHIRLSEDSDPAVDFVAATQALAQLENLVESEVTPEAIQTAVAATRDYTNWNNQALLGDMRSHFSYRIPTLPYASSSTDELPSPQISPNAKRLIWSACTNIGALSVHDWKSFAASARVEPTLRGGNLKPEVLLFTYLVDFSDAAKQLSPWIDEGLRHRLKERLDRIFLVVTPKKTQHEDEIEALIAARDASRKARDFKEADRIRGELEAMGITLKDAKDPKTGELVTTWEVAR